jgi:hypothetical protein
MLQWTIICDTFLQFPYYQFTGEDKLGFSRVNDPAKIWRHSYHIRTPVEI